MLFQNRDELFGWTKTYSLASFTLLLCKLFPSWPHEAEEMTGDFSHLDFFRSFGDAIAAMMAIDVLKRFVARIADAAMDLHGPICGFAAETVGPIVAHRHFVGEAFFHLGFRHLVHLPCGLADQQPQHFGLRGQLHQRPLNGLVFGQRLAERLTRPRILYAYLDAAH